MTIQCPKCGCKDSMLSWRTNTAMMVVGTPDISAVGNPMAGDTDATYFYICPTNDCVVHGNEL